MRILMIVATVCLTGCLFAPPPDELDANNWGAIVRSGGVLLLLEGVDGGGVLADAPVISLSANDRGQGSVLLLVEIRDERLHE